MCTICRVLTNRKMIFKYTVDLPFILVIVESTIDLQYIFIVTQNVLSIHYTEKILIRENRNILELKFKTEF